ncbi:putative thiopurine S-methyltransferase [Clavelina lepadiformis]|uniref:putative thiopurine S-methyltransferase n=1 Tax=Clavelina lepadiformis TaxID=159417 RepID=UPI004041DF08
MPTASIRGLSESEKQVYWQNHMSDAHPDMLKFQDQFLRDNCRVYLPLCGKSVDLKHLADKGHEVVGCEYCEVAILQFFEEQSIKYERYQHPTAPYEIFKATDKNITIYKGDFFALGSSVMGKVDAIWDRGSFVAIDPTRRCEYADVIHDIMNTNGKYLLYSVDYVGNISGTPYNVQAQEINDIFGQKFVATTLDIYDLNLSGPLDVSKATVYMTLLKPCT